MRFEVDPSVPRPAAGTGVKPDHGRRGRAVRLACRAMLLLLVTLPADRQFLRAADSAAGERRQNLRRVVAPAPRGVIYDREHRVLAGNRTHHAAVLLLGELREEILTDQRWYPNDRTAAHVLGRVRREMMHPANGAAGPRPAQLD